MKFILDTLNTAHVCLILPVIKKSINETNFNQNFLKKLSNDNKQETLNKFSNYDSIKGFVKFPLLHIFVMTDFVYKQEDFPAECLQNKINVSISQKYVLPKGWDEHMIGGYLFFIYHLFDIKLISKNQRDNIFKKVLNLIIKLNPCLKEHKDSLEKDYFDAIFGVISRLNLDDIVSYCNGNVYFIMKDKFNNELQHINGKYNLDGTVDVQFVLSEKTIQKLILHSSSKQKILQ